MFDDNEELVIDEKTEEQTEPVVSPADVGSVDKVEEESSVAILEEQTAEQDLVVSVDPEKSEEPKVRKKNALMDLDPERAKLPWYAIHTYSGFEQRVKLSLEERIRTQNLTEWFGNIIVPQETVEELVRGKKKFSTRKIYPGYIMVQMKLNDDTWHLVKGTPKVTGFIGDSNNPLPLSEQEVHDLLGHLEGGASKPKPKVNFEQGDQVKVVDGPFTDFNAIVDEVRQDKGKLRVLISIFGRSTPVELDFVQVEKL